MYYYICDAFLNDKKYEKDLIKIKSRLVDLGINGKFTRLSLLQDLYELIEDEVKKGTKNIIAIGNDHTLSKLINITARFDNLTIGIIPVGEENSVAKFLGIPPLDLACSVLSMRKVEQVDLIRIGNYYFMSAAHVVSNKVYVECDGYNLNFTDPNSHIIIKNCGFVNLNKKVYKCNPQDGKFELVVDYKIPEEKSFTKILKKLYNKEKPEIPKSLFLYSKIYIRGSEKVTIKVDGKKVFKPPIEVEIVPKKLKIIVAKHKSHL